MSDDSGYAGEPLSCVGEHSPASWQITRQLMGEVDAAAQQQVYATAISAMKGNLYAPAAPVKAASCDNAFGVPCEITRLRAENDALRVEVGGLRLRLESLELTYRAALADAKPARVVSPLHRAMTVRPGAFGLRVGMEG